MKTGKHIGKVLGELETEIMEIVWGAEKPISVSNVFKVLNKKREIAYTTVMTVMGRLAEKSLLKRTLSGKAYLYIPTFSKDTFLTRVSKQIVQNLVNNFGDRAIAHFAEELDKIPTGKKRELLKMLGKVKNNERE